MSKEPSEVLPRGGVAETGRGRGQVSHMFGILIWYALSHSLQIPKLDFFLSLSLCRLIEHPVNPPSPTCQLYASVLYGIIMLMANCALCCCCCSTISIILYNIYSWTRRFIQFNARFSILDLIWFSLSRMDTHTWLAYVEERGKKGRGFNRSFDRQIARLAMLAQLNMAIVGNTKLNWHYVDRLRRDSLDPIYFANIIDDLRFDCLRLLWNYQMRKNARSQERFAWVIFSPWGREEHGKFFAVGQRLNKMRNSIVLKSAQFARNMLISFKIDNFWTLLTIA